MNIDYGVRNSIYRTGCASQGCLVRVPPDNSREITYCMHVLRRISPICMCRSSWCSADCGGMTLRRTAAAALKPLPPSDRARGDESPHI